MIPAADARAYIEKHTDADQASIFAMAGPSARGARRHWTFRYEEQSSGLAKVAHLISRADVVDDRLFDDLRDLPGAAPQIVIEAAGDVVLIVRDYLELLSGVPSADQIQSSVARDYLLQILQTLVQWHSRGVYHGDLRPENVAVRGRDIQFVDFFARLPVDELGNGRLDYVAPELRRGDRRGSTSGDVYSFARLAVELLRPFRGDFRDPGAALLERDLSWFSDYCYVVEPEERPTAAEVLARFFPEEPGGREPFRMVWDRIRGSARKPVSISAVPAFATMTATFSTNPKLKLITNDSGPVARLGTEIPVDNFSQIAHIKAHDSTRDLDSRRNLGTFVEKANLGDDIDSRWRTSIHRLHFGVGLDRDHDARTKKRPSDPALVARDDFFDWHVHASREIRKTILDQNDFLYTSDVVDLLQLRIRDVRAADVTALRHLGAIIAIPDHDRWLYPAFQFNQDGEIDPTIQLVNDLLRHPSGLPEDEWSTLALWCLPQPTLQGSSLRNALLRTTFDELAPSLLPQSPDEPPYWFHAPQEIRTMATVEQHMDKDDYGTLQGESGEELLWDKTGSDLVLRWSADSSLAETLASFAEFVTTRPPQSLGAFRAREGSVKILPSAEVLTLVENPNADVDLLRLDLDRLAFVWETVPNPQNELPVADITAIFHPSQASKVEVMLRRTGTKTVRECARVAVQSVVLNLQAS